MPVYLIAAIAQDKDSRETATQHRLVEAKNEATALKFAVKNHLSVTRPSSAELVALGKDGVTIETAE